jgi:integration host factor subunit beta
MRDWEGPMTKSGLMRIIASRLGHMSARDVEIVVNTLFTAMTDALVKGDRIEIRRFGSFTVRKRQQRKGRNPKTGDLIGVPAKRVPFFTAGNELRERVNHGAVHDVDDRSRPRHDSASRDDASQHIQP